MNDKQNLLRPKAFFQLIFWIATGMMIAGFLWMPLLKHVIAGE